MILQLLFYQGYWCLTHPRLISVNCRIFHCQRFVEVLDKFLFHKGVCHMRRYFSVSCLSISHRTYIFTCSKLIFSKEPAIYGSSITIRRLPERYIFDVLLAPAPRKKQNGSQLYHVSET